MIKTWMPLFKTMLSDASGRKFYISTIISVAFSITVVLSTYGIMTGFSKAMLKGLKLSNGDIVLHHSTGSFKNTPELKEKLRSLGVTGMAPIVQIEAFALNDKTSSGVVLKGVSFSNYKAVTGLDIELQDKQLALGVELASKLGVKEGDYITVATGSGSKQISYLPLLARYQVGDIVQHGIYEKDERFIYMEINQLREKFSLKDKINVMLLSLQSSERDYVESMAEDIRLLFDYEFFAKPYWYEFSGLIAAVEAERFAMTLVLQIIVIIAMFNIAAFLVYVMNKKSQEIFLLRAVGMKITHFMKFWSSIVFSIWIFSCLLAILLTHSVDKFILQTNLIEIPDSVYHLPVLGIDLSFGNYVLAFGLTLIWMTLICSFWFRKLKKKPLLEGLREEFA